MKCDYSHFYAYTCTNDVEVLLLQMCVGTLPQGKARGKCTLHSQVSLCSPLLSPVKSKVSTHRMDNNNLTRSLACYDLHLLPVTIAQY